MGMCVRPSNNPFRSSLSSHRDDHVAFPKRNVENIVAADVAVPVPTRFIDTCLDVHSIFKEKVYYYEYIYRVSELI